MTASDLLVEGFTVSKTKIQDQLEQKFGSRPLISKVSSLGSNVIGFMSVIRRVFLDWPEQEEDLPKSVIIKIISSTAAREALQKEDETEDNAASAQQDAMMEFVQSILHTNEVTYLRNFVKYDDDVDFLYPKTYFAGDYGSDSSYLILKDYVDCTLVDLVDGFNEKQLYAITDEVVKIQSYGFRNEEVRDTKITPEQTALMNNFTEHILMAVRQAIEKFPDVFGDLERLLANTFDKNPEYMTSLKLNYVNKVGKWALIHGDLWAPQILWESDSKIGAIVDWQATGRGSPVEDLMRILTTCTNLEDRKRLQKSLFDHYYEELTKSLKKHNLDIPFTREELDEEYKAFLPITLTMCVFANIFWVNTGLLSNERAQVSFGRCKALIDEVLEVYNW